MRSSHGLLLACMRSSHGLLLACMRKLLVEELEPAANIYAHV